ncbi:hypothetical protein KFE98_11715 [bacterium SCSIO 12741]|nr:hypothetical protein KFE98_11715 [bacterium SCSIO 12741]
MNKWLNIGCWFFMAFFLLGIDASAQTHTHGPWTSTENERSDTFDILHYDVDLDVSDWSGGQVKGYCELTVEARQNNLNSIELDLLKMQVAQVEVGGNTATYTYNDSLLRVNLPTMNTGDRQTIEVWYQGKPYQDGQWGDGTSLEVMLLT